jgi:DNA-directed RNA polymerase subunit beta'
LIEGETFSEEAVEGGKKMIVITESKNRNLSPNIVIENKNEELGAGASILPVKANVVVREGVKVKAGQILVKIGRDVGKTRDITGGLPRIAELFEARNPSNPAVVTEVDGAVRYGKIKRGVRELHVLGKEKESTYKIPYGKHILVHEGDFVFAGDRLCEGAVSPKDILRIRGSAKVQEYLVEAIQEVYRIQGVSINDKHIEVIVRQMMQKITIEDSGDSLYLQGDIITIYAITLKVQLISRIFNRNFLHHLSNNYFNMFVINANTLYSINFLNWFNKIFLNLSRSTNT